MLDGLCDSNVSAEHCVHKLHGYVPEEDHVPDVHATGTTVTLTVTDAVFDTSAESVATTVSEYEGLISESS